MSASWGGWYGGNGFGSLNLASCTRKTETAEMMCQPCEPMIKTENKFSALTVPEEEDDAVESAEPTIGDAIDKAFMSMGAKASKNQNRKQKKKESQSEERKVDALMCLMTASNQIEQKLCAHNVEEEYEKISVMVDSGASETVASDDKFPSYELKATTAVGTQYSAAAKEGGAIENKGEKLIDVVDENGMVTQAKFQMFAGLSQSKILGSVSRLVQAGHTVVFRDPQRGSYIQNDANGYRNYLRQDNGSYYLDLWVKKAPLFIEQGK